MFVRPSYLRLSESGEVMTTQRTAERFVSGACADLNGADNTLGGESRKPFAKDLPGEGETLRRLGLMCGNELLLTESQESTWNTAPLSFKTFMVLTSTHDLRNGSPCHQPGLTLTL